ncbi:class II aldolase/adducin family protein [bacterium]|nr:class II aldolase/adducin family protein [bacterium]
MTKFLIIAGDFNDTANPDGSYGRPSSLANKIVETISRPDILNFRIRPESKLFLSDITFVNGGKYQTLIDIAENNSEYNLKNYDVVFWFPNVDNDLPKFRDIKSVNPKCMLINSKRNDDEKYSFNELIQKSLVQKANMTFEFSKQSDGKFKIRVFDPLGCVYADTTDIIEAVSCTLERLEYIMSITRQPTVNAPEDKNLIMKWYFDQFKQPEYKSDKIIPVPDEQKFVDIVRHYAHKFQEFMPHTCKTERFIGNASLKPSPNELIKGRCGKGMPSFRHDGDYIFVSKRNIDKQFIELDNFVPVYLEDDKLYYCGDEKPSVDTPVQVRLYKALPNINYVLHSHCYIEDAPFTLTAIPCGAIEEFDEIIKAIDLYFNNRNMSCYALNLIGHGSIVMANNLDAFNNIKYKARNIPEKLN